MSKDVTLPYPSQSIRTELAHILEVEFGCRHGRDGACADLRHTSNEIDSGCANYSCIADEVRDVGITNK